MTAKNFVIRKAAVLGAGVMGAQIAAHLANAKVPVVLFDLPAKEGPKNGIVEKAMPIHQSNVAIYNAATGKADRVGIKALADGTVGAEAAA